MTPQLAREARQAIGRTHREIGLEIGEPSTTVMKYELGKPVGEDVAAKLRNYFQGFQLARTRNGRVGFRQVTRANWDADDRIAEVGVDSGGRLYVRPSSVLAEFVGDNSFGVKLETEGRLISGRSHEWPHANQFEQILVAVQGECGIWLRLTPETIWSDVSPELRLEIGALAGPM